MGLQSGDGVVVVMTSSCGGDGWIAEVEAPLGGGGGGGGDTMDPVTGDTPPPSSFLAPDLGARVPVGLPCAPTWICVICLSASLDGESSTE
jgi:hypothetical protein